MLDPLFDLLAGLLAWFYSLIPSYGFAIIALTSLVLVTLSPLTYRSTKSMLGMRRVQPQVRRIQKKYAGDRERMNQEMMALYQQHNVSPLSGCLPILVQSPVFIVMFRVIQGITRRSSTIGFDAGLATTAQVQVELTGTTVVVDASAPTRNFNPDHLTADTELYQDLVQDNEMPFLGIDLSRTPLEALGDSLATSLPYLLMVGLVAALGVYQQRQIAGRSQGEISQQQQLIMRFLPWMLPIFAFTMPGGLVLYFIVSAILRIIQQAYLTRTVYSDEELTKPIELDEDDDTAEDDDDGSPFGGLLASLGGDRSSKSTEEAASGRHGSRRPTSVVAKRTKNRPPGEVASTATASESKKSRARGRGTDDDTSSGWGRAKRSAPASNEPPARPASRRTTPKGESSRSRKK